MGVAFTGRFLSGYGKAEVHVFSKSSLPRLRILQSLSTFGKQHSSWKYTDEKKKLYIRKLATIFPICDRTQWYFNTTVMILVEHTIILEDIGALMHALMTS